MTISGLALCLVYFLLTFWMIYYLGMPIPLACVICFLVGAGLGTYKRRK